MEKKDVTISFFGAGGTFWIYCYLVKHDKQLNRFECHCELTDLNLAKLFVSETNYLVLRDENRIMFFLGQKDVQSMRFENFEKSEG